MKVLYIEDHDDSREMLQAYLEGQGCEVTALASAADALTSLGANRFDVVITDFNLPDETGVVMLARAEALGILGCESVIISGAHQIPPTRSHFLRKPVDLEELTLFLNGVSSRCSTRDAATG